MDLCEGVTARRKDEVVVGWDQGRGHCLASIIDGRQPHANYQKQEGVNCR
jgi:hypothetical protein